jgi:hypothetical protein
MSVYGKLKLKKETPLKMKGSLQWSGRLKHRLLLSFIIDPYENYR